MRPFFRLPCILIVLTCCFAVPLQAQQLAASLNAGTMGPGVGLNIRLTDRVNTRLTGYLFSYGYADSFTDESADVTVDYNADFRLGSASALADWHPFANQFRLSLGVFLNDNHVDFLGKPVTPYRYNDEKTFSPEKLGTLSGTLEYAPLSPYAGIGFGNALSRRFNFQLDLGTLYTGSPEVQLEGTGMVAPTANHAITINDSLKSFRWYPFVSLGFSFRLTK